MSVNVGQAVVDWSFTEKDNVEIIKKVLKAQFEGKRKTERPRLRMLDNVQEDAKASGLGKWRLNALNCDKQRKFFETKIKN